MSTNYQLKHPLLQDVGNEMGRLDLGISISRPRRVKNVLNTERLRSAEEKLRNGRGDDSYTPMKFLHAVRYTFGKTNKRYFDQVHDILADDPGLGGDSDSEVQFLPTIYLLTSCQLGNLINIILG